MPSAMRSSVSQCRTCPGLSAMMPNHHITKPVLIGEIQDDGQFQIVSQTPGLVVR